MQSIPANVFDYNVLYTICIYFAEMQIENDGSSYNELVGSLLYMEISFSVMQSNV